MMTTLMYKTRKQDRADLMNLMTKVDVPKLERFLLKCNDINRMNDDRFVLFEYNYTPKHENPAKRVIDMTPGSDRIVHHVLEEPLIKQRLLDTFTDRMLPGTWEIYTRRTWVYPDRDGAIAVDHPNLCQCILMYKRPERNTNLFTINESEIQHCD